MVFIAILFCALLMYGAIYLMSNWDKFQIGPREENFGDSSIERTAREQAAEREKAMQALFDTAEFVNKDCDSLDNFIINDQLNAFDLQKLAQLNRIDLQIPETWFPHTLKLIQELHENGWDKRVSCIKEKYARLEFYTNCEYGGKQHQIIEKYGNLSEHICQTCGAKGEKRYGYGWEYVACYEHYRENRGKIVLADSGFVHNESRYFWNDVKHATFEDPDYDETYQFLIIEFVRPMTSIRNYSATRLYLSKNTIGFGKLVGGFPADVNLSDRDYARQFQSAEYCEVCGYEAVYSGRCECCESTSWESHQKRWKEPDDQRQDYIRYRQLWWTLDGGKTYESRQKNYPKNPNLKILFTSKDLEESRKQESEHNFD